MQFSVCMQRKKKLLRWQSEFRLWSVDQSFISDLETAHEEEVIEGTTNGGTDHGSEDVRESLCGESDVAPTEGSSHKTRAKVTSRVDRGSVEGTVKSDHNSDGESEAKGDNRSLNLKVVAAVEEYHGAKHEEARAESLDREGAAGGDLVLSPVVSVGLSDEGRVRVKAAEDRCGDFRAMFAASDVVGALIKVDKSAKDAVVDETSNNGANKLRDDVRDEFPPREHLRAQDGKGKGYSRVKVAARDGDGGGDGKEDGKTPYDGYRVKPGALGTADDGGSVDAKADGHKDDHAESLSDELLHETRLTHVLDTLGRVAAEFLDEGDVTLGRAHDFLGLFLVDGGHRGALGAFFSIVDEHLEFKLVVLQSESKSFWVLDLQVLQLLLWMFGFCFDFPSCGFAFVQFGPVASKLSGCQSSTLGTPITLTSLMPEFYSLKALFGIAYQASN